MSDLLSFYMTVKNGMPLLSHSVASLKAQTYPQWEAVIVDDGSSDGTVQFLEQLNREDERFRPVLTGGVGRAKALNLAIAHARGSIVANLDVDDLAHPERAERQMEYFRGSTPWVDVLATDSCLFHGAEHTSWTTSVGNDKELVDVTRTILRHNPIVHSSVMMRKEVLLSVGGYNENRNKQVDYELWGRLALYGYRLYLLDRVLAGKRIHRRQSYENQDRLAYLFSSIALQKNLIIQMNGGIADWAVMFARGGYGLLPQSIRMQARRLLR